MVFHYCNIIKAEVQAAPPFLSTTGLSAERSIPRLSTISEEVLLASDGLIEDEDYGCKKNAKIS